MKSFYLLVCTDYLYNLETRNRIEKILSYCGEYQIIGVVGINWGGGLENVLKIDNGGLIKWGGGWLENRTHRYSDE